VHLQRLVERLSRSEKRYVQLLLKQERKADARLLQLFEHMANGRNSIDATLDPRQIRKLRDLVLPALAAYYHASSPEHRLMQAIMEIDVLLRKEANGLARQRMDQAWRLAKNMAWNPYWARMAQQDALISRRGARLKDLSAKNRELEHKLPFFIREQKQTMELILMANRLIAWLLGGGRYNDPTDRKALDALEAHPHLQEEPDSSLEALLRYHEIKGTIAFHQGRYKDALAHRSLVVDHYSGDVDRIRSAPHGYIAVLNNYIITAMRLEDREAMLQGLERMRRFPKAEKVPNHEDLKLPVFSRSFSIEQYYWLQVRDFKALRRSTQALESELQALAPRMPVFMQLDFCFLLARTYFAFGEDEKALDHLESIVQAPNLDWRLDLQILARILHLILRFELGHHRLLESALVAFPRYAKRSRHRSAGTRQVLYLLRKLNYATGRKERSKAMQSRLKDMVLSPREATQWNDCGADEWTRRYGVVWSARTSRAAAQSG
jgi:hypothetical protein